MPRTIRKSTDNSAGHCFTPRPPSAGSNNVFINNIPAVRVGHSYPTHCCGNPCHGGAASDGSVNVFVNGQKIHRNGDAISCGDVASNGSPDVFAGSTTGESYYPDRTPTYKNFIGTDIEISGEDGPTFQTSEFEFHAFTHDTVEDSTQDPTPPPFSGGVVTPDPLEEDLEPAPEQIPPVQDCSTIDSLPSGFQWQDDCEGSGPLVGIPPAAPPCTSQELKSYYLSTWAPSFALSDNFTVASVTTSPAVSTYFLNANAGASQKQILLNLCFLAKTILEPVRSLLGPFIITSAFRKKSGSSQHNVGQAVDIQFPGYSAADYWESAKKIRDNINFDQFILEYGGRNPWFHLSAKPNAHRNNVLTQTAPNTYQNGLIRMA